MLAVLFRQYRTRCVNQSPACFQMRPYGIENFRLQLGQFRDITIPSQPLDIRMTANDAGGGTGSVQQNTIELLLSTPLGWITTITLFNGGLHAQTLQVVIDAGESLLINIDGQHLCFGRRFENMRGFTTRGCAQIQNLLAVFWIKKCDAALSGGILNGNPTLFETRQCVDRHRCFHAYSVRVSRMSKTFHSRLFQQCQPGVARMVGTVYAQPHWRTLVVRFHDRFPLCWIGFLQTFQQPGRM